MKIRLGLLFIAFCLTLNVGGCARGQAKAGKNAQAAAPVREIGSDAPELYRNGERRFRFTIPAGWLSISGDAGAAAATYRKANSSAQFQFSYAPTQGRLAVDAAVRSALKSAQQDVRRGRNLSAKRRHEKCESNRKVLCARGWEFVDNGAADSQHIIWQAYDRDNYYYNFTGSSDKAEFEAVRDELQLILDSVRFE